ncbi:MAG: response regulator [Marinilabiliaceae bacterium]|nr:response regulator [Marinilabiliaceae bacterium]
MKLVYKWTIQIALILLFNNLFISLTKGTDNIKVQKLFSEKGLPGSIVSKIYQDKNGYMWFAIESSGLYRYDGINFLNFQHNQFDTTSLINNFVNVIEEDQFENLWIGTTGGLDVKLKNSNKFTHLLISKPFNDFKINCIIKDINQQMLIGTNSGLYVYNNYQTPPSHSKLIPYEGTTSNSISDEIAIRSFFEDDNNIMWIGTSIGLFMKQSKSDKLFYCAANNNEKRNINITSITSKNKNELIIGAYEGVFIYNKTTDFLTQIFFPTNTVYNRGKAGIKEILTDNKNRWWIATMQYGLICVIPQKDNTIQKVIEIKGLHSSTIIDLFKDFQNNIWISSKYDGLYLYDSHLQVFEGVTLPHPNNNIDDFFVMAVCEDNNENLFVGTRSHGVFIYNNKYNKVSALKLPNSIAYHPRRIESLFIDTKNNLWIGSNKGFFKHSLTDKKTEYFKEKSIWTFYEDNKGLIWIGSINGIYIYNPLSNKISRLENTKHHSFFNSHLSIGIIKQTYDGSIWFGSFFDGLFRYFPEKDSLLLLQNIKENPNSISDNSIRSFYQAPDSSIWIGTRSQGLNLINIKTDSIEHILKSDGLASNAIYQILSDNNNNIWLGTDMGLIKLNRKNRSITNYNNNYGLPTSIFEPRSGCKLKSNKLAFGYFDGIIVFNPDSIFKYEYNSRLIISSIKTNGNILRYNLLSNDSIVLNHNENLINFEFALLDYAISSKNQYTYILEGFDNKWINPTNRNYATYTNLHPGNYKFKLKASNYQNDWSNDTIEVSIIIKPPFWKTGIAYFIYFFTITLLILSIYWIIKIQLNLRHKIIEAENETKRTIEIEETKIDFFTNIAHEFQTPLTLILAPIEKLINIVNPNSDTGRYVYTIKKNSEHLLKLIEQLLYFRKVQSGIGKLNYSNCDIISLTNNCIIQFQELAKQKNIQLVFNSSINKTSINIDSDKIEKVITNLIMNSLKYSYEYGKIIIRINNVTLPEQTIINKYKIFKKNIITYKSYIQLSFWDNGQGIPNNDKVFTRYYQKNKKGIGAGIGLDLAKTIIELHKGKIEYSSNEKTGTEFLVYLPYSNSNNKTTTNTQSTIKLADTIINNNLKPLNNNFENIQNINSEKALILIVDDNQDLLNFLAENMEDHYKVIVAENGQSGYEKASQYLPDIIISDVMMPEIDGIELCKRIKNDFTTCHIPFIMLSAKNSIEDKLEGLDIGADEYIEKPFNLRHLELKISGILQLRNNIQKHILSKGKQIDIYGKNMSVYDKDFLNKIYDVIQKKLSDSEYSVEKLSGDVGLSRAQLNRKLKALINQSPMELIYSIRLEEAKRLLSSEGYNVSDVAYMTGFKSPSSFSTVFKNKYGYPPSNISNS